MKHFTELFNRESNFKPRRFSSAGWPRCSSARWRGNIRELRNTVERLLIMSRGDSVDAQDIQETCAWRRSAAAAPRPVPPRPADEPRGRRESSRPPGPPSGRGGQARQGRHAARVQGSLGAGLPGREAARERLEHLAHRRVLDTPRSNLYKKLEQHQISAGEGRLARGSKAAPAREARPC